MNASNGLQSVATAARILASIVPFSILQGVAGSVQQSDPADWPSRKARIVGQIAQPYYRSLVATFLDAWQAHASLASSEAVAAALVTAAHSEQFHRDQQSLELVWTGPDVGVVPLRRTEQALLQLIDSAHRRITVVSYAVYNISRIGEALVRAADRNVAINVVIETPDRLEGQNTYNTLKALGSSVAARCSVFYWPLEKREKDTNDKPGILHVKCAVADGRWLFLSSANLTEYAFTLNMELGLLIVGGLLPVQVETQFDQMLRTGVLVGV